MSLVNLSVLPTCGDGTDKTIFSVLDVSCKKFSYEKGTNMKIRPNIQAVNKDRDIRWYMTSKNPCYYKMHESVNQLEAVFGLRL